MEKILFERSGALLEAETAFCAGCGHGIAVRLVAEAVEELGCREKTVAVAPVGCAVTAYHYWNFDVSEAAHGRPPAVATGLKRVLPDHLVFTYQGDGDLAAIGTAETIHAALRGEKISTIFVNNAVFGMTRGQMAPTTITGQSTTTSPGGRDTARDGFPLKVCEMLAPFEGVAYLERIALVDPPSIRKAKAAIRRSFTCQLEGRGYSLVELLSPCPVNWGLSPSASLDFIRRKMTAVFPVGVIKE